MACSVWWCCGFNRNCSFPFAGYSNPGGASAGLESAVNTGAFCHQKHMNYSDSSDKNRFYSTAVCFLLSKRTRLRLGMEVTCILLDGNCRIFALLGSARANSLCASHAFCTFETAVNSTTLRVWGILLEYILRHRWSFWDLYWGPDQSLHLFSSEMSRLVEGHWMRRGFGNSEGCKVYRKFVFVVAVLFVFLLTDCQMNVCSFFWSLNNFWQLEIFTNASSSKPFTYGHLVSSALHNHFIFWLQGFVCFFSNGAPTPGARWFPSSTMTRARLEGKNRFNIPCLFWFERS